MRVVGDVSPATVGRLAAIERAATLEAVLAWAHASGADIVEVIVQDEFTHDVIVLAGRAEPTPLHPGRGPDASVYLCFDTT